MRLRQKQNLRAVVLAFGVSGVGTACSEEATGGGLVLEGGRVGTGGTNTSAGVPATGGTPSVGGLASGGAAPAGGSAGSGEKVGDGTAGTVPEGGAADDRGAGGTADGGSLGEGGQPANPKGPSLLDAPTNVEDLDAFLELGRYKSWPAEPALHRGRGPHGRDVRVFYSSKAAAALTASAETFPRGAAVVKEILVDGASGWAVWVKAADDSDNGNAFFWYELIVGNDGTRTAYGGGFGATACVGCHSAGRDYLLADGTFE